MDWRITEPRHLLGAVRLSLHQGGRFLTSRIAPLGPILSLPNVSYIHKTTWGMYASGVDHATIARLLDWVQRECLQPNGDFFFPEEPPEYKDFQRVYRPLNFVKVAAWIDHPLARHQQVIDRILQYQHAPSGGVFHYVGDDPERIESQPAIGTLNTSFFGHLMVALDLRDRARQAGDWIKRWVEANRNPMAEGKLLTQMTPDGQLVQDVGPGEEIFKVVDTTRPKQEFWNVGTAMAYLARLYDVSRDDWNVEQDSAWPYLDAALQLLDFEALMPLDTYLWPSKCKVAWGAGELLRVLVKHHTERHESIEKAYRVAERAVVFTFLDNQLSDGGWAQMHYPLDGRIPEMAFSYKPLKDTVWAPTEAIEESKTIFLSREEITGEFLGEMKSVEEGVAAWLAHGHSTTKP